MKRSFFVWQFLSKQSQGETNNEKNRPLCTGPAMKNNTSNCITALSQKEMKYCIRFASRCLCVKKNALFLRKREKKGEIKAFGLFRHVLLVRKKGQRLVNCRPYFTCFLESLLMVAVNLWNFQSLTINKVVLQNQSQVQNYYGHHLHSLFGS